MVKHLAGVEEGVGVGVGGEVRGGELGGKEWGEVETIDKDLGMELLEAAERLAAEGEERVQIFESWSWCYNTKEVITGHRIHTTSLN